MIRVGSLCSGYGGLDMAVRLAGLDTELAFVADPDLGSAKVLAARYPEVPNLGDVTAVDWTRVPSVDVLTAGYPCQPFSLAGKREGIDDQRWIWDDVFAAIRDLRPGGVFLENVPGHLSMGFGRVLGDLASIGFDARWMCLRASDVGAAHRRDRVFVYGWPRNVARVIGLDATWRMPPVGERVNVSLLPTPTTKEASGPGLLDGNRNDTLRAQVALLKTPTAQLAINGGSQHPEKRKAGGHGPTLADQVEHLLPTPKATDGTNGGPNQRGSKGDLALPSAVQSGQWGAFAAAVARWEQVSGRQAPAATEQGPRVQRLAAPFVEWLMGLPEGWVTGVSGLSRNDQLRLLGNGVVPLQGAAALRMLAGGQ